MHYLIKWEGYPLYDASTYTQRSPLKALPRCGDMLRTASVHCPHSVSIPGCNGRSAVTLSRITMQVDYTSHQLSRLGKSETEPALLHQCIIALHVASPLDEALCAQLPRQKGEAPVPVLCIRSVIIPTTQVPISAHWTINQCAQPLRFRSWDLVFAGDNIQPQ